MATHDSGFGSALGPHRGLGRREQQLRAIAEASAPQLLRHLHDPDPDIQATAARALRQRLADEQAETSALVRRSAWLLLDSAQLSDFAREQLAVGLTERLALTHGVDAAEDLALGFASFLTVAPGDDTGARARLGAQLLDNLWQVRGFGNHEKLTAFFGADTVRELAAGCAGPQPPCDSYLNMVIALGNTNNDWRSVIAEELIVPAVVTDDRRLLRAWFAQMERGDFWDERVCEALALMHPNIAADAELQELVAVWARLFDTSANLSRTAFRIMTPIWDNDGDGYEALRDAIRAQMHSDKFYRCSDAFEGQTGGLTSLGREVVEAALAQPHDSDSAHRSLLTSQFGFLTDEQRRDPRFTALVGPLGQDVAAALRAAADELAQGYLSEAGTTFGEARERLAKRHRRSLDAFAAAMSQTAERFGQRYTRESLTGEIGGAFLDDLGRETITHLADLLVEKDFLAEVFAERAVLTRAAREQISDRSFQRLCRDREFVTRCLEECSKTVPRRDPGRPEACVRCFAPFVLARVIGDAIKAQLAAA